MHVIENLSVIIPRTADLARAYEDGSDEDCLFVKRLALLLGTYLKSFLPFFESPQVNADGTCALLHEAVVVEALLYMIRVSSVEDEDIFKTCLEFWSHFARELYNAEAQWKAGASNGMGGLSGMSIGGSALGPGAVASSLRPGKHAIFEGVLHSLRILMIDHMAKPEEVRCHSAILCIVTVICII